MNRRIYAFVLPYPIEPKKEVSPPRVAPEFPVGDILESGLFL
jgi:hypothetical protein